MRTTTSLWPLVVVLLAGLSVDVWSRQVLWSGRWVSAMVCLVCLDRRNPHGCHYRSHCVVVVVCCAVATSSQYIGNWCR